MFTYIKLKNFLSFGDVEFNFKKKSTTEKKFIAIYGENGSGKSNFVKAFDLLLHSIASFNQIYKIEAIKTALKNEKETIPDDLFRKLLSDADISEYISACRTIESNEPTEIEYGFKLNNIEGFYKLSFSNKFTNESLYYLTGKQRGYLYEIYEDIDGQIKQKFWSELFLNAKSKKEVQDEISKYWGRHTFLSIIVNQINDRNYNYITDSFSKNLLDIIENFSNIAVINKQSNRQKVTIARNQPDKLPFNLKSGKIKKDDLYLLDRSERILRDFFTQTYADIKDVNYEREIFEDEIKYKLFVDKMISGKIRHINFENESAGTQQILNIVRNLLRLFDNTTVIYDEIDNGIHDILLTNIINSSINDISGQLIITTHNTMLLESIEPQNAYVIRTDYLGNKDVKCFDEFSLQTTNNIRNKYLKGLFGGTPFIDSIDYDAIIAELDDSEVIK